MASSSDNNQRLEELVATPPVDAPSASVDLDGTDLTITVEGRAKPRFSSGLITAGAIFLASAFICPGIFVVALLLLPLAGLTIGGIYLFAPHLLEPPVDTQKLVVSSEDVTLIELCPRLFNRVGTDTDEITETKIRRSAVESTQLSPDTDGDDTPRGISICSDDAPPLVFGTLLADNPACDDCDRELNWLLAIVNARLGLSAEST